MNPNRKRKTYSENDIEKALRMTRQGVSIRQAARRHGIPAETLRDKVREKYPLGAKPGKDPVLTKQEETKIVSWVTSIARAGFPVSIKQLRISVGQFVRQTRKHTPFRNGIPGKKWVMLFLKRHPEISVRTPSVLARYRATITMEQIKGWFGEVHVYLEQDNLIHLLDCPDRVFNLDETSFDLVVKKRKCLAMKQSKHVYSVFGNNDKESYTALFTASASGVLLPPLVLFPYKQRIPGGIALTAPPDWGIGRTESGWMTGNAFYDFLKNVFQPWLVREGIPLPVLLFVDGHKSHATLMSTNFCKDHGIILICLFPNSTHLTQPLDVSFFRPMKQYWYDALSTFRANHGMRTIARTEICPLLKTAIEEFNNKEQVIVSGFRKSGLYPWNPEAVNFAAMPTNEVLQNENTTAIPDPVQEDRTFFHAFEARLSADQLKEFRKQEGSECWRGATEETNLFQFWKNWKREYENHNGSDDENDFLGFPEGGENSMPRFGVPNLSSAISQGVMEAHETDGPNSVQMEPMPSPSEEVAFRNAFPYPEKQMQKSSRPKQSIHLPAVATSQVFIDYLNEKEQEKRAIELGKVQKRKDREKKKQERETEKEVKKSNRKLKSKKCASKSSKEK